MCQPLVGKIESNGRIFYVDWATAQDLRAKYRDDPAVDLDAIVEPDFIWGQQHLPELVGGKLFDYVIASHVIEHVPNMIGWLREIASVLRDDGILSLAIPDKRFTFDFKRELTSFGALVEAHLLDRRRPSIRDVFDHQALACHVDHVKAWNQEVKEDSLVHHNSLETAWADAVKHHASDAYFDVHVTVVTPDSFLRLLECMNRLRLFDFTIFDFASTERNSLEFFVTLQRTPRRLSLEEIVARQAESIAAARSSNASR